MHISMDVKYRSIDCVRGFRYEVWVAVHRVGVLSDHELSVYIFSARPTKRQISALKRHFCKRLGCKPKVECIETDRCTVPVRTSIAGVFVSDKGPTD